MATTTRTPMIITHEGGLRFAAQVRSHRIIVDQPERAGGTDSGPMPIELLGASLGTCIALYVQQYCSSRGLPCEGFHLEVQQHGATNPNRIGTFEVRLVLPQALPAHHAEMLERVALSCPAHHTLTEKAEVVLRIEAGAAAPEGATAAQR